MDIIYSVDDQHPHPSSTVHTNIDTGTSEHHNSIVMGNHDESEKVDEISINYIDSEESFDQKTTIVDTYFSSKIANDLHNDPDPKTTVECRKRSDWTQWKDAIQAELCSLSKREVFTSVIPTPRNIFQVGYKWVSVCKRNKNNKVVRYKVRLVAQGFT